MLGPLTAIRNPKNRTKAFSNNYTSSGRTWLGSGQLSGEARKKELLGKLLGLFEKKAKKSHVSLLSHDHYVDVERRMLKLIRLFKSRELEYMNVAFSKFIMYSFSRGGMRRSKIGLGGKVTFHDLGEHRQILGQKFFNYENRLAQDQLTQDLLNQRQAMSLCEGAERINSVFTANNVNHLIAFFNELELLSQAYICIYYRVLELLDIDRLDRRYNFKELCNLYLKTLEESKLKKYKKIGSNIKWRKQIYATLMDDLLTRIFIDHRDAKLKDIFNSIKTYRSGEFMKIDHALRVIKKYRLRQERDEFWRFRKKIREIYPKETLVYALKNLFDKKNIQNSGYAFSKIDDKVKIKKILDNDIERGAQILDRPRKHHLQQGMNELIRKFGQEGRPEYTSKQLLPLRTDNVYKKHLYRAFSELNKQKLGFYTNMINSKQDEVKWYREQIKKRQWDRNINQVVDAFKTIKNKRNGDGHRKMILGMSKKTDSDKLPMEINKLYFNRLIGAFDQIKKYAKWKKDQDEDAKQKRIREGLIMLDLFSRNRINEGFSTIRTVVLMYEVLEIQEVTEEKELVKHQVKQMLDNSGYLNTSGQGLMNMSYQAMNPQNFLSMNQNPKQSRIISMSQKRSGIEMNLSSMSPMSNSRLILNDAKNKGVNIYNHPNGEMNTAQPNNDSMNILNKNSEPRQNLNNTSGPQQPSSHHKQAPKKYKNNPRKSRNRQKFNKQPNEGMNNFIANSRREIAHRNDRSRDMGTYPRHQKDSLEFKFEDLRSLSPIMRGNTPTGARYGTRSRNQVSFKHKPNAQQYASTNFDNNTSMGYNMQGNTSQDMYRNNQPGSGNTIVMGGGGANNQNYNSRNARTYQKKNYVSSNNRIRDTSPSFFPSDDNFMGRNNLNIISDQVKQAEQTKTSILGKISELQNKKKFNREQIRSSIGKRNGMNSYSSGKALEYIGSQGGQGQVGVGRTSRFGGHDRQFNHNYHSTISRDKSPHTNKSLRGQGQSRNYGYSNTGYKATSPSLIGQKSTSKLSAIGRHTTKSNLGGGGGSRTAHIETVTRVKRNVRTVKNESSVRGNYFQETTSSALGGGNQSRGNYRSMKYSTQRE